MKSSLKLGSSMTDSPFITGDGKNLRTTCWLVEFWRNFLRFGGLAGKKRTGGLEEKTVTQSLRVTFFSENSQFRTL